MIDFRYGNTLQSALPFRLLYTVSILLLSNQTIAETHATLTAMSEYLGKGYSKSSGRFSYLANLDYQQTSGFYIGSSAAYVNFGNSGYADVAHIEISPYLGWSFNLSDDWRFDTQYARYFYDGKIFGRRSDYNELNLSLHFRDLLSAAVSLSEDYYQRGHAAANYEMTGRYPITDFLEFSGSLGYTQAKQSLGYDYLYWHAGLTWFYKFVSLDLRYIEAIGTARTNRPAAVIDSYYSPEPLNPSLFFSLSIGF